MKGQTTEEKFSNFLLFLKKQGNRTVNIAEVIRNLEVPYRNMGIVGVLENKGLVKFVAKGAYLQTIDEVSPQIVSEIVAELREALSTSTEKSRMKRFTKLESVKVKTLPQEVVKSLPMPERLAPVNPFGFASFSEIMVEKGEIIIGEYRLTGSFTLTKIKDNEL